ncbi:MAG TPA: hypothetical protein PLL69_09750 [Gemmatimonadales bacterium]|nr:hypothetical protein [Gemmatimonadales bacterium]
MRTGPALLALVLAAAPLAAQEWRPGSALELVRLAARNRSERDIDTLLAGWRAVAHGLVRFTAEVDQGAIPVERLIKADELLVEVYGEGPNRSKQVITAWRDTVISPTSIHYHRDHLGIIANDFGSDIRLGDGDEVRQVPHPLSIPGLDYYRFRPGDTLTVSSGSGTIRVVMVDVRPADAAAPGVVGTLALDADRASLVRASFGFTGAAYRDPTVSSITVLLENALHEGGLWLPWRQAIAIRRGSAVLALPLATVIRAEWTIDDYQFGLHHPARLFTGPSVDGLREAAGSAGFDAWDSVLLAELGSDQELQAIAARAGELVRREMLEGLPRMMLAAQGGLSRFVRINRVQGVTLGAGFRWNGPAGLTVGGRGAVATVDGRLTGQVSLSRRVAGMRIVVKGAHEVIDANPWPRRSTLANSLATLITGDDAGDWYLSTTLGAVVAGSGPGWSGEVSLRREWVGSLESSFRGLDGGLTANPQFDAPGSWLIAAAGSRRIQGHGSLSVSAEYGSGESKWGRLQLQGGWLLPAGIRIRSEAGVGTHGMPAHRWFAVGGAGSLTGTVPGALGGRRLARLELSRPVAVAIPLPVARRQAGVQPGSRLAPYLAVAVAGGSATRAGSWPPPHRAGPIWSTGVRLELWGPLLQAEFGWAPVAGTFGIAFDAHPDWWGLL